ncbi:MAG: lipid-A-disaccharide synthase N-terminal domain-containing protein [Proteobacteria bacterium]|nr:lipid-A-disaccharide synthase N-terminal domain-containing protein [Pseudomonadota bacterium]MBU1714852.1 lipid-A-disaccharide synthase N-terminal domain-containing protein [Pseudomonadota bacterium]
MITSETFWISLGFIAQALFSGRFLVQWVASEKAGRSVIPVSFWFLSMGGGLLLLAYAIWRQDPVFILGQSAGAFVYSRNLYLIARERKLKTEGSPDQP